MERLAPSEIVTLLLGFAVMLGLARAFGELFNRFKQPAIVGEILAGILLGPTVLGNFAPGVFQGLFPSSGAVAIAYHTVITIAVVLLLLIAGLEIDLSVLWRQGRAALLISILGTLIPFVVGFGSAYAFPRFWGIEPGADLLTFALFFGTALSISALPVIAKIMMDLNLFKTDVGMLVMGAAMFSDLVGWIVFSIILGLMNVDAEPGTGASDHGLSIGATIGLTLALVIFALTLGRWLVHRSLPWIQSRLSWPGGVLSFTLVLALAGAAATEFIGIHAIFGAFLVGVAVGDSRHMRAQTRTVLHQFVTYIFAPIFFVSIGLEADFLANFDLPLILGVLVLGFAGKIGGCMLAARLGNLSKRDGWAISFGMNARGAMEIILGLLALQYNVIQAEMFVALVVLALLSSIVGGPLMSRFIDRPKEWRLDEMLTASVFVPRMKAATSEEAIRELSIPAAAAGDLDVHIVEMAVLARERIIGTSLGHEVAVPHARIPGLKKPVLVVGHSESGVDFDSPDGSLTRLIFLLLTPQQDMSAQIHIMGQIARLFKDEEARQVVYESDSVEMIRALVKTETAPMPAHQHAS
jgi:Kef-type K+ transport system membrane component KefB/mannitol/fructose-specific phosphotransferase system IIA component (Ntr-type)